jgi:nucleotide-binding universal stress UspA family protein
MAPNAISYPEILIPAGPCRHPHSPADQLAPTTQRLLETARQLRDLAAPFGAHAHAEVVRGRFADALLKLSAEMDLLVIGSRRWRPVARPLLRSTGEASARDAAVRRWSYRGRRAENSIRSLPTRGVPPDPDDGHRRTRDATSMNGFGLNSAGVEPSAPAGEESATHVAIRQLGTHESTLIVGLDGREHDAEALALAGSLQASLGGGLLLAHVVPPAPSGEGMIECERLERQQGRELLTRASANLRDGADTQLVEPCPAARGLSWLAAKRGASMLVLGSSHRGAVGRIVPGGTASHLLACAPCAIAVAPVGYANQPRASISRIGVAYDGTGESDLALAAAAGAGSRLSVPLRLYHAIHEISEDPAWDKFREYMQDYARGILDAGLKQLPPGLEATSTVLEGDVAATIVDAAAGDDVGLLFVGSRGYGPLREALLGGVAGALLHTARCPLVIVPRSAQAAICGPATIPESGVTNP